ncbi:MAG TPA: UbiA family prenyltransferase [Chthoniobacter sp.]|nr:UbiA family prenyltransferase [Chthoniobacter sp.]
MSDKPIPPNLRTWLQLLRAPNLFTVPGDPLAGFLLVTAGRIDGRLLLAVGASLCLYCHGLLINDLADLEEDRRERPHRPLPSGAARTSTVAGVAILLSLIALLFCSLINLDSLVVGLALLVSVLVYNRWSKKVPILGPLNMGLCRGLSILLGAAAGTLDIFSPTGGVIRIWSALFPLAVAAAVGATLYIAAVTHLARIETLANPPKAPRFIPFFALVAVIIGFFVMALDRTQLLRYNNIWLYLLAAYTLYAGYKIHRRLTQEPPPPIPPIIGQLIRLLLPLQAIFCLASRSGVGALSAAALLVLWPISRNVSRRFYAS